MGYELRVISYEWLQNKRNLMILLSIAIFLILIIMFFYLPLAGKIRKRDREWESLKSQLSIAQANFQFFEENGISKELIPQKEVSSVIDAITKEGRSLLLNFKSINQKEIRDIKDGYAVLPVQMEVEGEYKRLGRFFGALGNLKSSIVTIESFDIRHDGETLPKVSASLVVNIYLMQD